MNGKVLGNLIPVVSPYVQEALRGTKPYEVAKGGFAALGSMGVRWEYFSNSDAIPLIAVIAGAVLYRKGFIAERPWIGDLCSVGIIPLGSSIVLKLTPKGGCAWDEKSERYTVHFENSWYFFDKQNHQWTFVGSGTKKTLSYWVDPVHQERTRFVLKTLVAAGAACALAKLASMRNPSLPLKPYLYFGAGVEVLNQIAGRYLYPKLRKAAAKKIGDGEITKTKASVLHALAHAVCHIGIITIAAEAAKRMTCQEVQISKTWEGVAYVAGTYLTTNLSITW